MLLDHNSTNNIEALANFVVSTIKQNMYCIVPGYKSIKPDVSQVEIFK